MPLPWRFWRDPAFWAYTAWELVLLGFFVFSAEPHRVLRLVRSSFALIFWALFALRLSCVYWLIYDSYRWMIPLRWVYFWLAVIIWPIGLPYYLYCRPKWMDELRARRNKLY